MINMAVVVTVGTVGGAATWTRGKTCVTIERSLGYSLPAESHYWQVRNSWHLG